MADFAKSYPSMHKRLELHPLLGHAWKESDDTLSAVVRMDLVSQCGCGNVTIMRFLYWDQLTG